MQSNMQTETVIFQLNTLSHTETYETSFHHLKIFVPLFYYLCYNVFCIIYYLITNEYIYIFY